MRRIVVAESDPTAGLLLAQALTAAGHDVRLVTDALAAVSAAIALPAEILVLSTTLPKGRPAEVIHQVRAAGVRSCRLIGLVRHGDHETALPEADAWLSWPLGPEDLLVVDDVHA